MQTMIKGKALSDSELDMINGGGARSEKVAKGLKVVAKGLGKTAKGVCKALLWATGIVAVVGVTSAVLYTTVDFGKVGNKMKKTLDKNNRYINKKLSEI